MKVNLLGRAQASEFLQSFLRDLDADEISARLFEGRWQTESGIAYYNVWSASLSFSVLVWSQLHKNAATCKSGWGDSVQTPAYQMGTIADLLLLIQLPLMSCTTCLIQSEWKG